MCAATSNAASKKAAELRDSETWIFDLDNTLYPARCNLFAQIDVRMGAFIAAQFDIDRSAARALQKTYFRRYGTTLRGLMLEHGLEPQEFLDYVHDIDLSPIAADSRLDAALARLPGRKFVFTNGSQGHAERVVAKLGIAARFDAIFDIVASDYLPKPSPEPYQSLVARHGIAPEGAVMVEDIARNLEPAAAMGMTTVLVPGHKEWQGERQAAYVHYLVDDLADWLYKLGQS